MGTQVQHSWPKNKHKEHPHRYQGEPKRHKDFAAHAGKTGSKATVTAAVQTTGMRRTKESVDGRQTHAGTEAAASGNVTTWNWTNLIVCRYHQSWRPQQPVNFGRHNWHPRSQSHTNTLGSRVKVICLDRVCTRLLGTWAWSFWHLQGWWKEKWPRMISERREKWIKLNKVVIYGDRESDRNRENVEICNRKHTCCSTTFIPKPPGETD